MEIDEFEGHYTATSCLEAVLMGHFDLTNTCPYEVHATPWFLSELMKETYDRGVYRSADDFPTSGRISYRYSCAAGTVKVLCDPYLPKEMVFDFRCKCGTNECLVKELRLR